MKPSQVLDQQALLIDRLSTPTYQAYMQPFLEDVARKKNGPVITDDQGRPSGWHFCKREVKRLSMAEAYFVSKEMVAVATWAADSLDESDEFRHDLWPSDFGFLWLDEVHIGTEMWGRQVTTCAMSWGRTVANGKAGSLVIFYTDMRDERDQVNTSIKEAAIKAGQWEKYAAMGNLHVHHILWIPDGTKVGPAVIEVPQSYAQFAPSGSEAELTGASRVLAKQTGNDGRFLLSLLMMFNQTVASVETEEADRATAKRMRRMNLPARVTVITLRRKEGQRREGESLVEWQHRWPVRGHWAWRKCSQHHPDAQPYDKGYRVRLFIAPYIKGPEDKPLFQTEKVYSLQR